jgi:hypothetical protein
MKPDTKLDAIKTLMREARLERRVSNAAVKRIMKACDVLGCDMYEIRAVLIWLEVCKDDGTPYSPNIKRVWW